MTERIETVKAFIERCSDEERRILLGFLRKRMPRHPLEEQWDIDADTILTAIYRSPDLTQRGVRGILAEAVFERDVLPQIERRGWRVVPVPGNDRPYDFLLGRGPLRATIQVKLQRSERGKPKLYKPKRVARELYVAEIQKTRSGTMRQQEAAKRRAKGEESTRPYRFGDFDILAVNMQPSTGKWGDFRYTVSRWLIPRGSNPHLIEIFQPVSPFPNDVWTDRLEVCLDWFRHHERRSVRKLLRLAIPRGRHQPDTTRHAATAAGAGASAQTPTATRKLR
jgi:hypothetical protein